jgi:hypothetical protein
VLKKSIDKTNNKKTKLKNSLKDLNLNLAQLNSKCDKKVLINKTINKNININM